MDRIHMLILQTCDLIFFLIAVIILILFCVYFICTFDSVCVFFYFIVSLSIFCLFVLCLKNSNESRIHEAMSACMAKIISHITELLFGTSPKKNMRCDRFKVGKMTIKFYFPLSTNLIRIIESHLILLFFVHSTEIRSYCDETAFLHSVR